MRSLFGTDGIRGRAGEYPLDPATVSRIGAALAVSLRDRGRTGTLTVVVGCDTRGSSPATGSPPPGGPRAAPPTARPARPAPRPRGATPGPAGPRATRRAVGLALARTWPSVGAASLARDEVGRGLLGAARALRADWRHFPAWKLALKCLLWPLIRHRYRPKALA